MVSPVSSRQSSPTSQKGEINGNGSDVSGDYHEMKYNRRSINMNMNSPIKLLGILATVALVTIVSFHHLYENSDALISFIGFGSSSSTSSTTIASVAGVVYQDGGYVSKGATSGAIFTGVQYRTYKGRRIFSSGSRQNNKRIKSPTTTTTSSDKKKIMTWEKLQSKLSYYRKKNKNTHTVTPKCTKWAVVTTIFKPTEALVDIASLQDWCLVITGDNKTSKTWLSDEPRLNKDNNSERVFFMSIEEQNEWSKLSGPIGEFVKMTPYNHFARKNIGYLYAILRGAKFIYDFDDDNYLNRDSKDDALLPLIPNGDEQLDNVRFVNLPQGKYGFNHHPLMSATIDTSWARGFPLEDVLNPESHGTVISTKNSVPMNKIGVIQYCANNNPDIDAIHRLTKPLPMNFKSSVDPVQVPINNYSPYNAQATIHTYDAFFAILLPASVTGRVTDIWRGYFAQGLFKDLDLRLIFTPPSITQYRNIHNILGDMESEKDLYLKSNRLVEFLHDKKFVSQTVPGKMEELFIDLYERGYIETSDVVLVQRWLEALESINYKFKSM